MRRWKAFLLRRPMQEFANIKQRPTNIEIECGFQLVLMTYARERNIKQGPTNWASSRELYFFRNLLAEYVLLFRGLS
jgi:hypothetical protein